MEKTKTNIDLIIKKVDELNDFANSMQAQDALAAKEAAQEALELATKYEYREGKIYSLFYLGESQYRRGNFFDAVNNLQIALSLTNPIKDIVVRSQVWNILGNTHLTLKVYDLAFHYYQLALDAAEAANRLESVAMLYNNIGEIYRELGDYTNALKAYESSMKICEKEDFSRVKMYVTVNMGVTNYQLSKYDIAKEELDLSLSMGREKSDFVIEGFASRYLGLLHQDIQDFDKAKDYLEKCIDVYKKTNEPIFQAEIYKDLGKLYFLQNKYQNALDCLDKAYELTKPLQAYQLVTEIVDLYSFVYESIHDYTMAHKYNKLRFEVREKRVEQEKAQRLISINIQLRASKAIKESENFQILNKELEEKTKSLEKMTKELRRMNKELKALGNIDGLTKLSNRKKLDTYLNEIFSKAIKQHKEIAILVIDVDSFKEYNDYYGHLTGDDALKTLANILKQAIEDEEGIAARFGGDEFVLVLYDINLEKAKEIGEKIQEALSDVKIENENSIVNKFLTVSVGITCSVPRLSKDKAKFIDLADKALYLAKDKGKNRIELIID